MKKPKKSGKPEKVEKPPGDSWSDPYTKQNLLSPEMVAALRKKIGGDPNMEMAPIAGACLVELYKEQFSVKPSITYDYQKPFDNFQSSFILLPAKGLIGGMKAWTSMATALDQINQHFADFEKGENLVLVAPPPRRDGRMHVTVKNTEELVKLIREQRPDIYSKAETNLRMGSNYQQGERTP